MDDTINSLGVEPKARKAMEQFQACLTMSSEQRSVSLEDVKFVHGEQWLTEDIENRKREGNISLTCNELISYKNQVVNDGIQNQPTIKIRPTDDQANVKKAEVLNGLIRHILYNGDSKSAIDWAFDCAVTNAFGFYRVCTEYKEGTFEQEISIKRIENPFSVYFPYHLCSEKDWSDTPYVFVRTRLSKTEFKDKYPKKDINSSNLQGTGDSNWMDSDSVYIVEYFVAEETEVTIYLIEDPVTKQQTVVEELPEGVTAIKERTDTRKKWYRYVMTYNQILEDKQEWPCKYQPIIPILGHEHNVDGKKIYTSFVTYAKDPQRMYNYQYSAFTQQVALQPKVPFIVANGQIPKAYLENWNNMHKKNLPFIMYEPTAFQGQVLPAPQRVEPPQMSMALLEGINLAKQALQDTTGLHNAAMGKPGKERSGKQTQALQRQSDTSTYHFTASMNHSIKLLGKILLSLIPAIYDMPRVIRILHEDMSDELVKINQPHIDPNTNQPALFDLKSGDYDVVSTIGASYDTKRLEAADNIASLIASVPQIGQVAGDILVRNMDFPGADELSNRIKKTIPPQLLDNGSQAPTQENQIRLQQQLQQAAQEKQQMIGTMQQMIGTIKELEAAVKDKSAERDVKLRTTMINASTELQKAQLEAGQAAHDHVINTALKLHSMAQPAPDVSNQPGQNRPAGRSGKSQGV